MGENAKRSKSRLHKVHASPLLRRRRVRNRIPLLVRRHYQTNTWRPSASRNPIYGLPSLFSIFLRHRLLNILHLFRLERKEKNFIDKIKEFGHTVITEVISVFFTANGLVGLIFGSYYGFFVMPGPIVSRIISGIIIILSVFYFYNHQADKYKGILFKNSIPLLLISLALEQIGRLTIL